MTKVVVLFSLISFLCIPAFAQEAQGTVLTDELLFTDEDLKGDILFIGGYHGVHNHLGELAVAKQNHDFTGYLPIEGRSDSGYVIVNHELILSDPILGDGGGMTVFTVHRDPQSERWEVVDDARGKYRSVDFSEVGGTLANCGGFQTAWGTVLTAEETVFYSNEAIYREGEGITDTTDFLVETFNGQQSGEHIRKFENFDWMVEVDVADSKAIRKCYNMGRYGHEGGTLLPDGKSVFLTDDFVPGFVYKFVAHQPYDLSAGTLYAYKQNENGVGGSWLEMPMDLRSMINAPDIAAELGATMFNRTEWAVNYQGKVYFTETGYDDTGNQFQWGLDMGANMSQHLKELDEKDGTADNRVYDYYGRILELDMETGQLRVYLEGGTGDKHHLSNPDGLAITTINGNPILMINEDLNGYSHGRVPPGYNQRINEIFCLDLTILNPSVDDLHKLAVGPKGCETTGGRFTPDGSTYFVNIQHPISENKFPFNNAVTVAVRNVDSWIANNVLDQRLIHETKDRISFTRDKSLNFEKKKTFKIFNMKGEMVMEGKGKKLNFYHLNRGKYQLLLDDELKPLVIK